MEYQTSNGLKTERDRLQNVGGGRQKKRRQILIFFPTFACGIKSMSVVVRSSLKSARVLV